jgi:hypothetical protein
MKVEFYPEDLKDKYQMKGEGGIDQAISTKDVTADKLNDKAQAVLRIVGRAVFYAWDKRTYNAVYFLEKGAVLDEKKNELSAEKEL